MCVYNNYASKRIKQYSGIENAMALGRILVDKNETIWENIWK